LTHKQNAMSKLQKQKESSPRMVYQAFWGNNVIMMNNIMAKMMQCYHTEMQYFNHCTDVLKIMIRFGIIPK